MEKSVKAVNLLLNEHNGTVNMSSVKKKEGGRLRKLCENPVLR